jgi:hypothetical protein
MTTLAERPRFSAGVGPPCQHARICLRCQLWAALTPSSPAPGQESPSSLSDPTPKNRAAVLRVVFHPASRKKLDTPGAFGNRLVQFRANYGAPFKLQRKPLWRAIRAPGDAQESCSGWPVSPPSIPGNRRTCGGKRAAMFCSGAGNFRLTVRAGGQGQGRSQSTPRFGSRPAARGSGQAGWWDGNNHAMSKTTLVGARKSALRIDGA